MYFDLSSSVLVWKSISFRTSYQRCSIKKVFLKILVFRPATLFKKKTPIQVFSCEYWEIFKNTYFEEHLRTAASEVYSHQSIIGSAHFMQLVSFYTGWKHQKTLDWFPRKCFFFTGAWMSSNVIKVFAKVFLIHGFYSANIYLFNFNNKNTRKRWGNMFKVNKKDTITTSFTSFSCVYR